MKSTKTWDVLESETVAEFVRRLKRARQQKGLSIFQLAEACDMSRAALFNIERGTPPSFRAVVRLEHVLGETLWVHSRPHNTEKTNPPQTSPHISKVLDFINKDPIPEGDQFVVCQTPLYKASLKNANIEDLVRPIYEPSQPMREMPEEDWLGLIKIKTISEDKKTKFKWEISHDTPVLADLYWTVVVQRSDFDSGDTVFISYELDSPITPEHTHENVKDNRGAWLFQRKGTHYWQVEWAVKFVIKTPLKEQKNPTSIQDVVDTLSCIFWNLYRRSVVQAPENRRMKEAQSLFEKLLKIVGEHSPAKENDPSPLVDVLGRCCP
jgi:transcriptional regulator with XRE-family HTH domain